MSFPVQTHGAHGAWRCCHRRQTPLTCDEPGRTSEDIAHGGCDGGPDVRYYGSDWRRGVLWVGDQVARQEADRGLDEL